MDNKLLIATRDIATISSINILVGYGIIKYLVPRVSKPILELDSLWSRGFADVVEFAHTTPLRTTGFIFGAAYISAKIDNLQYICKSDLDEENQENDGRELQENKAVQLTPQEHFYYSLIGNTLGAGLMSFFYTFNKERCGKFIRYPHTQKVVEFCEQRPVTAAVLAALPACYNQISRYFEDYSLENDSNDDALSLI